MDNRRRNDSSAGQWSRVAWPLYQVLDGGVNLGRPIPQQSALSVKRQKSPPATPQLASVTESEFPHPLRPD
jgi:hypothetical protein